MTKVGTRDLYPQLNFDVFVTTSTPIATSDPSLGSKQAIFQAIASTLLYGMRDAVLVDAFMTVKQVDALLDLGCGKGQEHDNNLC
jgi:hypothetical protein